MKNITMKELDKVLGSDENFNINIISKKQYIDVLTKLKEYELTWSNGEDPLDPKCIKYYDIYTVRALQINDDKFSFSERSFLNGYSIIEDELTKSSSIYCTCSEPQFKQVLKGFNYTSGTINYCVKCKKDQRE